MHVLIFEHWVTQNQNIIDRSLHLFNRLSSVLSVTGSVCDVTRPEVWRWRAIYGSSTGLLHTDLHPVTLDWPSHLQVAGLWLYRPPAPGHPSPPRCRLSAAFTAPWRRQVPRSRLHRHRRRLTAHASVCRYFRHHSWWRHRLHSRRWVRWPSQRDLLVCVCNVPSADESESFNNENQLQLGTVLCTYSYLLYLLIIRLYHVVICILSARSGVASTKQLFPDTESQLLQIMQILGD